MFRHVLKAGSIRYLVYSSLRQQIKTTHLMQCGALYCEVNSEHEKVTALTDCLLRKINMRFYALEG